MERLTEKRDGQNVIPLRQNGKVKWSICSAGLGDAPTEYLYGEHADRLAAYEDTGLEPEQITAEVPPEAILSLAAQFLGVEPGRLRELAQAYRDGRCVVLPVRGYTDKDGEQALNSAMNTCFYHNNPVTRYIADAVAEKLTREAAEAALKGDQHEQNL